MSGLSAAQLESFNTNGFLVLEDNLSAKTVSDLRSRMAELVDGYKPEEISVFSTEEQTRTSDDYFLSSGDKIRYFFEEGAVQDDGTLIREASTCINKVGHALHDLDAVFRKVTYSPSNAALFGSLGFELPMLVQSMYIFKQPGIGGKVDTHQDGTFLYTEPQSVVGLWWALEDCTTTNGCLWAVPGSHTKGVHRWFKRSHDERGTVFEPPEEEPWDISGAECLEVKAGTLVLLHHALVHFSEANSSDKSRHAYTVHVVEGGKDTLYPKDNWLQTETKFHTFADYDVKTNSFTN